MARFLHSLLPALDARTAAEHAAIVAARGTGAGGAGVPWQAPHHTSSLASLIGGGSGRLPGAVSLAHGGVLYLNEIGDFPVRFLHALTAPLKTRQVTLARAGQLLTLPARFQLITSSPPCGCSASVVGCDCPVVVRRRFARRAWPLVRHTDVRLDLDETDWGDGYGLTGGAPAEIAALVADVRVRCGWRWKGVRVNADAGAAVLSAGRWRLAPRLVSHLETAVLVGLLDAAGYVAVLRVAWTLADLAGRSRPDADDVRIAGFLYGLTER